MEIKKVFLDYLKAGMKKDLESEYPEKAEESDKLIELIMSVSDKVYDQAFNDALSEVGKTLHPLISKSMENMGINMDEIKKRFMQ